MEQKLYSPVFCKMYTPEDYHSDTPEMLSQRNAAEYADKIELLIHRENKDLDSKRGLMECAARSCCK